MKTRFSTLDIGFELSELQKLVGMRVNKVYDVDHKTYILKLHRPQEKAVLLLESGIRIHSTRFEWPKNEHPSGFSMKLRKHLANKRLESIKQLGVDRVIDLTFGSADAAYHIILELYDKGNLVLTDHQYLILNILRPRVKGEEKFITRETYPVELVKTQPTVMTLEKINDEILPAAFKENTDAQNPTKKKGGVNTIKKMFLPFFDKGPAFLEHLMTKNNIDPSTKVKTQSDLTDDVKLLIVQLFADANEFSFEQNSGKGYISQEVQQRPNISGTADSDKENKDASLFYRYIEFHPLKFDHLKEDNLKEFDNFDTAVDNFFSQMESQKIDAKAMQKEMASIKKLENVKKDHEQRIKQLKENQDFDRQKGELIELNDQLVERALMVIRSALANQLDWNEIKELLSEAAENGDPVVSRIKDLKLDVNQMTMLLENPYSSLDNQSDDSLSSSSEDNSEDDSKSRVRFKEDENKPLLVELDIDLTAQANARKYYDKKRSAATKETKTIQSQSGAIKSAERRAKQDMRDANAISRIIKARKVFWFEKFLWFISSENYLVIAGRDQTQNEMIVKRYLRNSDVYVHAEVQGASSVIIKNPDTSGQTPIPPKTLNEAGQMAVCYSIAWDQKVVVSAYWVHANQVSKTAPSGEYLNTGSFMIRGKKNFLPPSHLTLGFGFMFKIGDEESILRHKGDRKVKYDQEEPEINNQGITDDVQKDEDQESVEDQMENLDVKDSDSEMNKAENEEKANDHLSEGEKSAENEGDSDEINTDTQDNVTKDDHQGGEGIPEFPDAELEINFSSAKQGKVIEFKTASTTQTIEEAKFVNDPKGKGDSQKPGKAPGRGLPQWKLDQQNSSKEDNRQKRGKKGKLKKMKEKYKDQDEEDKMLAMKLLQESQKNKEDSKKYRKKQEKIEAEERKKRNQEFVREKMQKNREKAAAKEALKQAKEQAGEKYEEEEDSEDDEKDNGDNNNELVDVIDSITGNYLYVLYHYQDSNISLLYSHFLIIRL